MAEKEVREVGIIGQMYEDRKTKRRGVLESREEKYKTLMMRDIEGNSFNITYSTFRSNWRKYQGEEVIQTSTQVEEAKAEEAQRVEEAEEVVEEVTAKAVPSREEKVKAVRAFKEIIVSAFAEQLPDVKIDITTKGGIKFHYKHRLIMEAWIRFKEDKYTYCAIDDILDRVEVPDYATKLTSDSWALNKVRFPKDKFADMSVLFVNAVLSYIADNYTTEEETNEENEENEEE